MKLEDWGETFTKDDFDNCRATACTWNTDDGLPHDAARVRPGNTSAVNVGAHAIAMLWRPRPVVFIDLNNHGAVEWNSF